MNGIITAIARHVRLLVEHTANMLCPENPVLLSAFGVPALCPAGGRGICFAMSGETPPGDGGRNYGMKTMGFPLRQTGEKKTEKNIRRASLSGKAPYPQAQNRTCRPQKRRQ